MSVSSERKVSLRRVRRDEDDARLLLGWRNDAATRAASFDTAARGWEDYWRWFGQCYVPEGLPAPVIAESDGIPIASVRFETPRLAQFVKPAVVEISIHVAPEARRRGLGLEVLDLVEIYLSRFGVSEILALVKSDNTPSHAFFRRAGYREVCNTAVPVAGQSAAVTVYRRPIGSGDAVRIAPLRCEDVTEEYVGWLNDPEVMRYTEARYTPHTMEGTVDYVRRTQASANDELFRIMSGGVHVGNIRLSGISRVHRRASIGIIIGRRDRWGQGVAVEAINQLADYAFHDVHLHKLVAGIYAENNRSRRAFEKAGFKLEAILKENRVFEDRFIDELLLARFSDLGR